jgi:hypothetical protein
MLKRDIGKLSGNFAILGMLVICLVLLTSSTRTAGFGMLGRQSEKKVVTLTEWPTAPVKFIETRVTGKAIEFTKEFDGGDDWIRGIVVALKNTSNRNIIYISLLLQFPETQAAGPIMSASLEYGRYSSQPSNGNYDKLLKPDEEVEIKLPDTNYDNLRSFLSSGSFNKVNALHIHLDSVIFDDDTGWFGGILMRRDPGNPKKWDRIDG